MSRMHTTACCPAHCMWMLRLDSTMCCSAINCAESGVLCDGATDLCPRSRRGRCRSAGTAAPQPRAAAVRWRPQGSRSHQQPVNGNCIRINRKTFQGHHDRIVQVTSRYTVKHPAPLPVLPLRRCAVACAWRPLCAVPAASAPAPTRRQCKAILPQHHSLICVC